MARQLAVLLVVMVLPLLWRAADSSYEAVFGRSSTVFYNDSSNSYRFPDVQHLIESNYDYFLSNLNFDGISGKVLCGAADKLYILSHDLQDVTTYPWLPEQSKKVQCDSQNMATKTFTCRNHIRIYKQIPTLPSDSFLVCGSQATEDPQCRILSITSGNDVVPYSTLDAPPGVVSYYPGFSQLGEFREKDASDITYISAGFFQGGNGVGRRFSISYQNVTATTPSNLNMLSITETRTTLVSDSNWLRYPVTFVDLLKLNYVAAAPATRETDYHFYFIFFRENAITSTANSDDIIQSRVARICQNDPGIASGSDTLFNSFMKARIYCERQMTTGDEFDGAINYFYNELRSISFAANGSYYDVGTSDTQKLLYGAFTSPVNGPHGTAICVYSAENTAENGGAGRTQSMFDIFRGDLTSPTGAQVQNSLKECAPEGRSLEESRNILIFNSFIDQLGNDPLLVLDEILVSQMVLDQQCVFRRENPAQCVSQDVLFLGTNDGKIIKVTFANRGSGLDNVFPVISEEVSLDDDNSIEKMMIREVGGSKALFVNTYSKLYRFPLERCSRHQSCLECMGSRDPYCVWDMTQNQCVSNPYQGGNGLMTVDSSRYKQDIHDGEDDSTGCSATPACNLITSALTYSTLQLEVHCNTYQSSQVTVTVPSGLIAVSSALTLDGNGDASTNINGTMGFHSYVISASIDSTTFSSTVTTPPGVPLVPTSSEVLVESITSNSLKITLNIATFTDSFKAYQFRVTGVGSPTAYQSFTAGLSLTLSSLSPATTYSFQVEVKNTVATATTSTLTARTLDSVPTAVRNLVATPTDTTVTLQWDAPQSPNGVIVGYNVLVGGSVVIGCAGYPDATIRRYEVVGVSPFVAYTFSVAGCTSAGEGPGTTVAVTTLCGTPERVTNLRFHSVTHNTLTYSWGQPSVVNGDAATLQYQTHSDCYNGSTVVSSTAPSSGTEVTLSDLLPLTRCCVQVTPVNRCTGQAESEGPLTEKCEQTSDIIPGQVRGLGATGINHEGLLVVWSPPENYQRIGLSYTVTIGSDTYTIQDRANIYLDGLSPSTSYTVSVSAGSGAGTGGAQTVTESTLAAAPVAPTSPELKFVDNTTLRFSWEYPNATQYQITSYEAVVRCNEINYTLPVGNALSVDVTITDPRTDLSWCTGQVLAVSNTGKSPFSSLAYVAVPTRSPSTPRCYLVDDQGSSVTFSFDVTHPFSLEDLNIRYLLVAEYQTPSSVSEKVESFGALASNVLTLPVARNTEYDFQLRVCNEHGCSNYCQQLRNFTTSSTAPRPPSAVVVSDVTFNSASFSWETPSFENASNINYTVQVGGPDLGSTTVTIPGTQMRTEFFRGKLQPQTMYTVGILVTDRMTGTVGPLGGVTQFTTLIGTPSRPIDLGVKWDGLETLSASWLVPAVANGTLTRYEVYYSGATVNECDDQDVVMRNAPLGTDTRQFTTTDTKHIVESKSILFCVRAHTDKPGAWASVLLKDIVIGNLGGNGGGSSSGSCSGLIAVAVVAMVAVVSTLVASIVLVVVVRRNNKVMDEKNEALDSEYPPRPKKVARSASEYGSSDLLAPNSDRSHETSPGPPPSLQSTDTGYGGGRSRPELASNPSIDSSRSTAHLIRNNGTLR